ncbi:hypothetical protein jhhlp_004459 [Lomentospora prolificans]|uniref:G-protein coupled receptors family 2 profile 2 domain-containing protein n=1 Tax=Lomentospora prolificans TaxID=41688 RepID=A0A2N3NBL1_9PEZI|nr:hypothetical protein jhhlp_004459 [Lomentospora prolificans]
MTNDCFIRYRRAGSYMLIRESQNKFRFMPADSLWTLSMAINVHLTFYHRFDAAQLRKLEPHYLVFNYAVPFVPAFVFLWLKDKEGTRVYGEATIWCWVSREWDIWRVITFYGPVWVVIVVTMAIYLRASGTLYRNRKQLHAFRVTDPGTDSSSHGVIETDVTTETNEGFDGVNRPTAIALVRHDREGEGDVGGNEPGFGDAAYTVIPRPATERKERRASYQRQSAAWAYAKYAILFFTAIFVTWIPSSANRIYTFINKEEASLPLEYIASFVLTLQGFWNCLIYIRTSWSGCKTVFADIWYTVLRRISKILGLFSRNVPR